MKRSAPLIGFALLALAVLVTISPGQVAAAEAGGLAVLHYDADFDVIARVTGQPCEWVVPAGSID